MSIPPSDNLSPFLESITDAFFALDNAWRFQYINSQAERLLARPRTELLGRSLWDEFPEAVSEVVGGEYRRAVKEQTTVIFEAFYPPLGAWFENRVFPSSEGLSVFFQDITERVERTRRERFLSELTDRARGLTDPKAVISDTVHSVGRFLGAYRCAFADIDTETDNCTVPVDYRIDESVVSQVGSFPISAYGASLVTEFAAGRAVVVDDVRTDPVQVPPETVAAYEALGIRAHVTVPVVHSTRLVSILSCHSATPRHWTPEEIALLQTVVDRTWLTVEVIRQQSALVREAKERREAQSRAERTLERIGDAFFALDTEWRFTYINSHAELLWGRTRAELLGKSVWDEFPQAVGSTFDREFRRAVSEGVTVPFVEFYPPLGAWLDVRAYPSEDGLSVFFQNVNTRKALEIERERLSERERNIARQLQEALQPTLPEHVRGLSFGSFTRPALDEASIGGDFLDVFALDKELYALVIGDVSGKGLAAAQQLALIRNSLRTTLYLHRAPAQAADALNRIVTAHDLLVGLVTVWVGVYDAVTGRIAYASCGHEPGMVRRAATDTVEVLETTGPPLGIAENADFGEASVTLMPGDDLLLYTDGISEAGPNRQELLGTAGLTYLFTSRPERTHVQAEAEALVARVGDFAGGAFRDDVAVLLARRDACSE